MRERLPEMDVRNPAVVEAIVEHSPRSEVNESLLVVVGLDVHPFEVFIGQDAFPAVRTRTGDAVPAEHSFDLDSALVRDVVRKLCAVGQVLS